MVYRGWASCIRCFGCAAAASSIFPQAIESGGLGLPGVVLWGVTPVYALAAGVIFRSFALTWVWLSCPDADFIWHTAFGTFHLGNYFGMMRPAIDLQEQGETLFHCGLPFDDFIDGRRAAPQTRWTWRSTSWRAGWDPKRTVFFRQSDVPEVTELTWIIGTVAPMGLLERCHSYKDKIAKGIAFNFGLFAYPVLMAADILLYDSNLVPVGRIRNSMWRSRGISASSSTKPTATMFQAA